MARRELLGVRDVRAALSDRLAMAQGDPDAVHTVVLVDSQPRGVVVSMAWRRRAADALGEPLDLEQVPIVAVTALRDRLGAHVGGHVIAARRNQPLAALVPWDWYLRAAKALNERVDL